MPPHAKESTLILSTNSDHRPGQYSSSYSPITKKSAIFSSSSSSSSSLHQLGNKRRTTPKAKGSVSFNNTVRVLRVLHINHYTRQEVASTWFSRAEMSFIKSQMKEEARQLECYGLRTCQKAHTTEFCERGLEHRTKSGGMKRMENRAIAIQSVLLEQDRQWEQNVSNPTQLAFVYMSENHHCQVVAQEIGMDDEYDCLRMASNRTR